jgi:hypothetical protein
MPVTITIPSITLSGWKTYICAASLIIASVAKSYGYLSPEQYTIVMGLLTGGGFAALRAGVQKSGPQAVLGAVEQILASAPVTSKAQDQN